MTAAKRKTGFDAALVREMAALLNETGLSEIEFDSGDLRIRVAKAAVAVAGVAAPPPVAGLSASVPAPGEPPAEHPGLLTSPMVGVVYTAAEPDAPAFVKVGDTVAVGDTVLLIEAMKVFNPIKAHRAGRVARVFVSNGVPVEYGEPLLLIE
jgi:acetyl-CoA carboxylase biotin carboxyl carrier protein